ncbi:MAG: hypothetical protein ACLPYY_12115 [Acidimicrobiales bacterium]
MDKRRVWLSPRALRLHAVILIVVPTFLALCYWQITRALGGNSLSWAYVFEWPIFAGYAVYMWWRFVHEAAEGTPPTVSTDGQTTATATTTTTATTTGTRAAPTGVGETGTHSAQAPEEERVAAELAAYNEYLAQLAERDRATGR